MARTANTDVNVNPDVDIDEDVDGTTEGSTKKSTVNAIVSQDFKDAVVSKAKEAGYTESTFLEYHLLSKMGMVTDAPPSDFNSTRFIIGTQVDLETREAIERAAKEAGKSRADYVRMVAAEASGYDLSREPERVPAGQAFQKMKTLANTQSSVLAKLWDMLDAEAFDDVIKESGTTYEALGLTRKS